MQTGVVGWPVGHLAPLVLEKVAAILVQLEGQEGRPEFGNMTPYVTLCFSTARSMHLYSEQKRSAGCVA